MMLSSIAESILNENLFGGGGGSNIKSKQSGALQWNSGVSYRINIDSVDITKSILLLSSSPVVSSTAQDLTFTGKLISGTEIELIRYSGDGSIFVAWQVIEFEEIKSLQRGYFSTTSGQTTVSISAIDPVKTILIFSASTTSATTDVRHVLICGRISSSTQLTFNKGYSNEHRVEWQVVEFK